MRSEPKCTSPLKRKQRRCFVNRPPVAARRWCSDRAVSIVRTEAGAQRRAVGRACVIPGDLKSVRFALARLAVGWGEQDPADYGGIGAVLGPRNDFSAVVNSPSHKNMPPG